MKKIQSNVEYEWLPTCCKIKEGDNISAIMMFQCENELENNGECPDRHDPDHKMFNYHFAKLNSNGSIMYKDDKPLCKYKLFPKNKTFECWHATDEKHLDCFAHDE